MRRVALQIGTVDKPAARKIHIEPDADCWVARAIYVAVVACSCSSAIVTM